MIITKYSRQWLSKGFTFFVLLSLLSTCNTLKKAGFGKKDTSESSARAIISAIEKQSLQADWFTAKARISYKDKDMSVSGSATIRMKTDSLLWISIKKLGFEVARAAITKDSVYVLDRLNNEYAIYGLDYLQESYNLPGDFQLLQSVVFGKPYFFDEQSVTLSPEEDAYVLKNSFYGHQIEYQVDQKDLRLLQLDYETNLGAQKMKIDLTEYEELADKQLFSYFRTLKMNSPDTGTTDVTIKFSQVELDTPKEVQFRIPSRYTKMD